MPVAVECKSCGSRFGVADDLFQKKIAGRKVHIRCKQCGEHIPVDGTGVASTDLVWMVSFGDDDDRELNLADIAAALARGEIGPETLVWTDGMPEWQLLGAVPELAAARESSRPKKPRKPLPSAPLSPLARARLASITDASSPPPGPGVGQAAAVGGQSGVIDPSVSENRASVAPASESPVVVPAESVGEGSVALPVAAGASLDLKATSRPVHRGGVPSLGGVFDVELEAPRGTSRDGTSGKFEPTPTPSAVDAPAFPRPKRPRRPSDAEILGIERSTGELGAPALDFDKLAFAPVSFKSTPAAPVADLDVPITLDGSAGEPAMGKDRGTGQRLGSKVSATHRSGAPAAIISPPSIRSLTNQSELRSFPGRKLAMTVGLLGLGGLLFWLVRPGFQGTPEPLAAPSCAPSQLSLSSASPVEPGNPAAPTSPTPTSSTDHRNSGIADVSGNRPVTPTSMVPEGSARALAAAPGPSAERTAIRPVGSTEPKEGRPRELQAKETRPDETQPQRASGNDPNSRPEANSARSESAEAQASAPSEPFDVGAASAALSGLAQAASSCRKPGDPGGVAVVMITFAPSGRVTSANISGAPFAGTPTGGCIASTLRRAKVPPFAGSRTTVRKSVVIQ